MKIVSLLLIVSLFARSAQGQSRDEVLTDKIYQKHVKTVQLYPITNLQGQEVGSPIIPINQSKGLLLQFDLLEENYSQLQARIIHCDADWTVSSLSEIEYLNDYNSFDIRDFDYSINTKQLYVNYWITLPKVKITGNYIVQVFQNNNKSDVLFTRRFIVYDNLVPISPTVRVSTTVIKRRENQQIDFDIAYQRVKTANPRSEFKVVIRQNQRWDTAISDIAPTQDNRSSQVLEYRYFNGENNFPGGNEFRFIDLRTYSFRGRYISSIDPVPTPMRAEVALTEGNSGNFYSQLHDMNGAYIIETMENGARYLEADYLNVKFRLKSEPRPEAVYLLGAFNFWKKDDSSLMMYDSRNGYYFKYVLLKQGIYDYQYWVDGRDPLFYEASFSQTGNTYEIIVYHKSYTDRTEKVVGYTSFIGRL